MGSRLYRADLKMSITINNTIIQTVDGKARVCSVCRTAGHDKRNCPSTPKIDKAAIQENHLKYLSRKESGPARLTDPGAYWASLGPDSGTYPFERDVKGCLHMPAILKGSYSDYKVLEAMPEYKFDPVKKVYNRIGPCPGCV